MEVATIIILKESIACHASSASIRNIDFLNLNLFLCHQVSSCVENIELALHIGDAYMYLIDTLLHGTMAECVLSDFKVQ